MNDLTARVRASLWWLLPLLALVLLIGGEIDWGRAPRIAPPPAEPIAPKPVVTGLLPEYAIAGGLGAHAETVNRTLFNPTRRPAPVAIAEAAKPRIQRGQFALTGTTVAGDRSLAFLKEQSGGKARTVRQGDTINGMLVAEVKPDRVKFTLGRRIGGGLPQGRHQFEADAAAGGAGRSPARRAGSAGPAGARRRAAAAPPQQQDAAAQTLAERRRAARAAEAAAASAATAGRPRRAPASRRPRPRGPARRRSRSIRAGRSSTRSTTGPAGAGEMTARPLNACGTHEHARVRSRVTNRYDACRTDLSLALRSSSRALSWQVPAPRPGTSRPPARMRASRRRRGRPRRPPRRTAAKRAAGADPPSA